MRSSVRTLCSNGAAWNMLESKRKEREEQNADSERKEDTDKGDRAAKIIKGKRVKRRNERNGKAHNQKQ